MSPWRVLHATALLFLASAGCTLKAEGVPSSTPQAASPAIAVSGSGSALPLVQRLATTYGQSNPLTRFRFDPGTNSGGAIQGVISGTLDPAVVSRPLSESESKEPLAYRILAVDAVAFAVHTPNGVEGLSSSELQDIYGGDLTSWGRLGGGAEPIVVLDSDQDESSLKLVLLPMVSGFQVRAGTTVLTSTGDMISALESTPNSQFGYAAPQP